MRKTLLFTTFALALILSVAGGAQAADVERYDGAAAEALELPLEALDFDAFQADIDLSAPAEKAGGSCSASLNCGDGNTVSCNGTSSCTTTIAGVKCDGTEVRCPNYCSVGVRCPNGGLRICWSTSGDCVQNPPSCNGFPLICFGPL